MTQASPICIEIGDTLLASIGERKEGRSNDESSSSSSEFSVHWRGDFVTGDWEVTRKTKEILFDDLSGTFGDSLSDDSWYKNRQSW
jgi:hypothetical protein